MSFISVILMNSPPRLKRWVRAPSLVGTADRSPLLVDCQSHDGGNFRPASRLGVIGHENFRFVSTADSAAGNADAINNFDVANDTFTFSGINVDGGHIEFVDNGTLRGSGQASAHLLNFGAVCSTSSSDLTGYGGRICSLGSW